MRRVKSNRCGFTLIELVVTMAVVALLASIAYPSYVGTIRKARREDAMAALLEVQLAQEKYRANHPQYASSVSAMSLSSTSHDGYYTVEVTASTATTFEITATATGAQAGDSSCATLVINQSGPDISTAAKKTCWNKS